MCALHVVPFGPPHWPGGHRGVMSSLCFIIIMHDVVPRKHAGGCQTFATTPDRAAFNYTSTVIAPQLLITPRMHLACVVFVALLNDDAHTILDAFSAYTYAHHYGLSERSCPSLQFGRLVGRLRQVISKPHEASLSSTVKYSKVCVPRLQCTPCPAVAMIATSRERESITHISR